MSVILVAKPGGSHCFGVLWEKAGRGRTSKRRVRDVPGGPAVRILCSMQQAWVRSLVKELRFHMPHGQKKQNRSNILTNSIMTLKNGAH